MKVDENSIFLKVIFEDKNKTIHHDTKGCIKETFKKHYSLGIYQFVVYCPLLYILEPLDDGVVECLLYAIQKKQICSYDFNVVHRDCFDNFQCESIMKDMEYHSDSLKKYNTVEEMEKYLKFISKPFEMGYEKHKKRIDLEKYLKK